jgi:WD40 repeat protein
LGGRVRSKGSLPINTAANGLEVMASPEFKTIIETPSPISCMDVVDSVVVLGCEDGSVRRFNLPETKVQKALIGAGKCISWIRFSSARGEQNSIWLATGMEASMQISPTHISVLIAVLYLDPEIRLLFYVGT